MLSSSMTCTYATIVIPTPAVSLTVTTALETIFTSDILPGGFGFKIVSPSESEKIRLDGGSFASKTWIKNSFTQESPPLSLHIMVML